MKPYLAIAFALLGALAQALTSILQRVANLKSPEGERTGWQTALYLVRQPLWLLGMLCLGGTFVFTALALYLGTVAAVQPILVTELIFTLGLRVLWLRESLEKRVWIAAGLLCVGLFGFLAVAHPQDGSSNASTGAWIYALSTRGAIIVVLYILSRWGSPARRAALLGACAAMVWAVDAAFVKTATDLLAQVGVVHLFFHWPVYAVIISGILGTVLLEAAFSVGPLTASQPALLIVDPIASILIGIELFGETIRTGSGFVVYEILFIIVMCLGVWFLSQWAPPEEDARSKRSPRLVRTGNFTQGLE